MDGDFWNLVLSASEDLRDNDHREKQHNGNKRVVFVLPCPAVLVASLHDAETLTSQFPKPFCRVREEQDHHFGRSPFNFLILLI